MIVPSSFPQPQNPAGQPDGLRNTVDALLRIVPADKVFFHNDSLHIVLGEEAVRSLQQYKVMLEGTDWNPAGYPHTLYALPDVCRGLDEGKLMYTDIFRPERQVYDNGQSVLPAPLPLRLARIVQQSREEFCHGYRRSEGFLECAVFLLKKNDPELAAFMLHQSVEQLLRGYFIAATGQELKTHTLADLVKQVRRFTPVVWTLCGPVGEEGRTLVSLLEKAYICGRYALHFTADSETLAACTQQVAVLQQVVARCFYASEKVYEVCFVR